MQTVKGVKVRCIKLLKNKVYKFARYIVPFFSVIQYHNIYYNKLHIFFTFY